MQLWIPYLSSFLLLFGLPTSYPVAYSFQVPKGGLAFLEPHLLDYAEKKGFVSHEEAQWARIKRVARLNPNPLKLGRITIYE